MKYYFSEFDEEYCYLYGYLIEYMKDEGIDEMEIYKAKRETGTDTFFCKFHKEVGIVGENCGIQCKEYMPRNGKNGRCKYSGHTYCKTGKVIIIKRQKEGK